MMSDPSSYLGSILDNVIGLAKSLVEKKIDLFLGVEDDVKRLSSILTSIKAVLKDAEEKQLGSHRLTDWLGKLKKAALDAEDILAMLATQASLWEEKRKVRRFLPPSIVSRVSQKLDCANDIKQVLERLDEIAKEKEQYKLEGNANAAKYDYGDRITSFVINTSNVVGREDDKNKIVGMLLSEEFDREGHIFVIPITGMGGVGKTTLAQLVYNDSRVKEKIVKSHFEFLMWVCVSDTFDYRKILTEMLEYHTEMKTHHESLSTLESRLLGILKGKRFLLVLDDVWTESREDWERLERILIVGKKGSRVLVTSRSIRVSEVMATPSDYRLELNPLPEDQCWSLFEKIVFKECNLGGGVRRDLEDIGGKIVGKCNGLPLAVKAMGGLLRGDYDVNKWRNILKHEIWEAEQHSTYNGRQMVLPALKLSYDHLRYDIKQCFEYCYIFPKAYVFNKMEVVKLWKAASLIQPRGQYTADEIGSDCFDCLLTRSFFQVSKVDSMEIYTMHDLIHDLAQSVSSHHCYQVKDSETCRISESHRHISLVGEKVEQLVLEVIDKSPKVRTLLFPTKYLKDFGHTLDKLFHTLKYLRTLDLSSSTILELPKSVGELKLLHYLDLSKTEIRMLPNSICNIYNLQTLKLLGCLWLFELPKDFHKLVNLQHLELDDMFWDKLYSLPSRMGSLTSLQNLHAFRVSRKKGYRIDELKNMRYLTGALHILNLECAVDAREAKLKDKEGLTKIVYQWSNRDCSPQDEAADGKMLEDLQPPLNLTELQIFHFKGTRFPSWVIDGLLQNLVTISLNNCTKCKVLSLNELPHLRELYIKGLLELEEWTELEYDSLDGLTINNCPKLKVLPIIFHKLQSLKIKKCGSLVILPWAPNLKFLILADNIVLEDWNERVLKVAVVNDQKQLVTESRPSFINLLELKIRNCPKVCALPKVFMPQKLEISRCPLLTTLLPEYFTLLQNLALDACPATTLVGEIPDTNILNSLIISDISDLKFAHRWPHLPELKALYIHQCKYLVSLAEEEASFKRLSSLKLLSIRDCPKLVTLPATGLPTSLECLSICSCNCLKVLGPRDILKNLNCLKDLYIENCMELQSLPEDGLPASLQHLLIEECPLLTTQCRKDTGLDWPKIINVPDLEIEAIEVSLSPKSQISWSIWKHLRYLAICILGILLGIVVKRFGDHKVDNSFLHPT